MESIFELGVELLLCAMVAYLVAAIVGVVLSFTEDKGSKNGVVGVNDLNLTSDDIESMLDRALPSTTEGTSYLLSGLSTVVGGWRWLCDRCLRALRSTPAHGDVLFMSTGPGTVKRIPHSCKGHWYTDPWSTQRVYYSHQCDGRCLLCGDMITEYTPKDTEYSPEYVHYCEWCPCEWDAAKSKTCPECGAHPHVSGDDNCPCPECCMDRFADDYARHAREETRETYTPMCEVCDEHPLVYWNGLCEPCDEERFRTRYIAAWLFLELAVDKIDDMIMDILAEEYVSPLEIATIGDDQYEEPGERAKVISRRKDWSNMAPRQEFAISHWVEFSDGDLLDEGSWFKYFIVRPQSNADKPHKKWTREKFELTSDDFVY